MGRNARGIGARLATAAVAAVLSSIVLILVSGTPTLPNATAHYVGTGDIVTSDQHLADGWYVVSWTARAGSLPTEGCLFGLRLEQRRTDATTGPQERSFIPYRLGKLAFRTVPRESSIAGSSGPIPIEAGDYGLVVDGSCGWDVTLVPTDGRAIPSNYGGPRM